MSAQPNEAFHEQTADGRDRHYMRKDPVTNNWVCECGETRDKQGHQVDPRPMTVLREDQE